MIMDESIECYRLSSADWDPRITVQKMDRNTDEKIKCVLLFQIGALVMYRYDYKMRSRHYCANNKKNVIFCWDMFRIMIGQFGNDHVSFGRIKKDTTFQIQSFVDSEIRGSAIKVEGNAVHSADTQFPCINLLLT